MHSRYRGLVAAAAVILLSVSPLTALAGAPPQTPGDIKGKHYRMERAYFVLVHVPTDNMEKVLAAVSAAVGLEYGHYDQVAYIDAEGLEQDRPLAGSKMGEVPEAGRAPSKVLTFSVPHDAVILQKALDAIYTSHAYEEPVIYVTEVWRSRATSSDEKNPNKWWNNTQQDPRPSQPQ